MKAFSILHMGPCDSGCKVSVVKANSEEDALDKYKKHLHGAHIPSWVKAIEITEDVQEVYQYDNPNYEG